VRGRFGWGAPEDEGVHSYVNELALSVGTYLYGRRMYETMVYFDGDAVRRLKADSPHDITVDGSHHLAPHSASRLVFGG
jgi:hypothetical protein